MLLFCICLCDNNIRQHSIRSVFWFLPAYLVSVSDLIFLQGKEVVLKMALVLLGNHKELIKQCIGFESIVEFLKTDLPEMGIIQLERVINEVDRFFCLSLLMHGYSNSEVAALNFLLWLLYYWLKFSYCGCYIVFTGLCIFACEEYLCKYSLIKDCQVKAKIVALLV